MKKLLFALINIFVLCAGESIAQDSLDVYTIRFHAKKAKLTNDATAILDSLGERLGRDSALQCRICCCSYDKKRSKIAWNRINNTIKYLSGEKNISENRFHFTFDCDPLDCNFIDLIVVKEEPGSVPAPHPNL